MNESRLQLRVGVSFGVIFALFITAVTAATLLVIAGGWVVNWTIPSIKVEFACLIFGQGLLLTAIPIAVFANSFSRHMEQRQLDEDDDDDQDDEDNGEAAEWLAERIADLTLARMNQGSPKDRSYAAKARRK